MSFPHVKLSVNGEKEEEKKMENLMKPMKEKVLKKREEEEEEEEEEEDSIHINILTLHSHLLKQPSTRKACE